MISDVMTSFDSLSLSQHLAGAAPPQGQGARRHGSQGQLEQCVQGEEEAEDAALDVKVFSRPNHQPRVVKPFTGCIKKKALWYNSKELGPASREQ